MLVVSKDPLSGVGAKYLEDLRICLNLGNLSQGGDCWKVSQIIFCVNLESY